MSGGSLDAIHDNVLVGRGEESIDKNQIFKDTGTVIMSMVPSGPPLLAVLAKRAALAPTSIDHLLRILGMHDKMHTAIPEMRIPDLVAELRERGLGGLLGKEGGNRALEEGGFHLELLRVLSRKGADFLDEVLAHR
jgi:hypothetical protein